MKFSGIGILCALLSAGMLVSPVISAGAAWDITIVDSIGDVGLDTSVVLNSRNFPVISYRDNTSNNLKVAVCSDEICARKTLVTVDSPGNVGNTTSLTLNSSGFPVISYFDSTNEDLKVAVCSDATCTGKTLTIVDSVGAVGEFTSLALNSSGFPVISYYDITNEDLKVAVCTNATCTSKTLTTVDSIGNVGKFSSLALNGNGFPVISYRDDTNAPLGDLKLAVCSNKTCTSKVIVTVDSGDVGIYTSLDLSNSGFPVISYADYTNVDVKVAICTNTTCTSRTITVVDSAGQVGIFTSLALNSSNFPVISYYDASNGDLKLAMCSNTNCTSKTLMAVDSLGDVGAYTSLTLNGDSPVISYYDLTNRDLKIALLGTDSRQASLPRTGFSPNHPTDLSAQPANLEYRSMADIWLEIPSLKLNADIVGVPKSSNGWNVDWLGNNAGWLNGTAFPTWEGNSVITAHVYNVSGLPGPFVNLKDLRYGDRIIIHLSGQQYLFAVQDSRLVNSGLNSYAFEHLEDRSYLTLITCQDYDEKTDSYRFRRIIRAVLINVK